MYIRKLWNERQADKDISDITFYIIFKGDLLVPQTFKPEKSLVMEETMWDWREHSKHFSPPNPFLLNRIHLASIDPKSVLN